MSIARCVQALALMTAFSLPQVAMAAGMEGTWTLNYPFEEERWYVNQANPTRFVAFTDEFIFLVVYARFGMTGTTTGPTFRGTTYFLVNNVPVPTGIVTGTVVGNQMNGRVFDYAFGVYDLEGMRVLLP